MKIINRLIIPIIIVIVTVCSSNINWGKSKWKNIILVDGKGYYAYLPAVFIYQDLNFSFFDSIEKKYSGPQTFYDYRVSEGNKRVDKYFVGTAIAMSPFFLIAHISAKFLGFEADGYSKIYPVMINVCAIFYLFLGLYYLKKLLKKFNDSDGLISFVLIAITFATNIFYYTICEPAMSHIYSFAFVTMFIYFLRTFFDSPQLKTIYLLSALLGIIILIRPVNGLVLLIAPFISGSTDVFARGIIFIKKHLQQNVLSILLFFGIVSIQFFIYKIQTGSFLVDSYGHEMFNWTDPHPLSFLISYKKGLFIYTPLAFVSLLGLYKLFKQNKFQFYSLSIFLIILLYVLSSWWSWWYGGSFSSRVSVEYYAIIALLICFAYEILRSKWSRIIYSFLIVCLLFVCQIQTYQYRYYFIHWDKMDKAHYWNVFLRIDQLGKENPNADLLK